MKRSFYLFNPGIMERRDNTLKFTPVVVNEDNEEIKQQPRFIPIGMWQNCMPLAVLKLIVHCIISWDRKAYPSISLIIMRTIRVALCRAKAYCPARHCWHKLLHTRTRKSEWNLLESSSKGLHGIW